MTAPSDTEFDPYHKWLGIPAAEQPANHYRLLGLAIFEDDPEVISAAADRQMAHVKSYAMGRYATHSQQLLNVLSKARLLLLNAQHKSAYDGQLREQIEQSRARQRSAQRQATTPAPVPSPVTKASAPSVGESMDVPNVAPAIRVRRRRRRQGHPLLVNLMLLVLGLSILSGLLWFALQTASSS